MKIKMIAAALTGLLVCSSSFAGEAATALRKCLYNNTTDAEKTTFTQWAFVTLGKTDAAKSIATISSAKTKEVNQQAKTLVTKLVTTSCSSEAKQVALKEPTSGLQDAVVAVSSQMIADRLSSKAKSTFSNSLISEEKAQQLKEAGTALKNLFQK